MHVFSSWSTANGSQEKYSETIVLQTVEIPLASYLASTVLIKFQACAWAEKRAWFGFHWIYANFCQSVLMALIGSTICPFLHVNSIDHEYII